MGERSDYRDRGKVRSILMTLRQLHPPWGLLKTDNTAGVSFLHKVSSPASADVKTIRRTGPWTYVSGKLLTFYRPKQEFMPDFICNNHRCDRKFSAKTMSVHKPEGSQVKLLNSTSKLIIIYWASSGLQSEWPAPIPALSLCPCVSSEGLLSTPVSWFCGKPNVLERGLEGIDWGTAGITANWASDTTEEGPDVLSSSRPLFFLCFAFMGLDIESNSVKPCCKGSSNYRWWPEPKQVLPLAQKDYNNLET